MYKPILAIVLFLMSHHPAIQESNKYVTVSLSKTQCFGQCPAFKFELYSDSTATFEGIAHVELMGNWTAKLSDQQYQDILSEFEMSDFFQFSDRYYEDISDLPTTYLFYSDGEKEKNIMDYYGAPEDIKKLETKVEELIAHLKWSKRNN